MEQNVQVQAKPIKIPGPDHPISIERDSERVIVSVAGIKDHLVFYPDRVDTIEVQF